MRYSSLLILILCFSMGSLSACATDSLEDADTGEELLSDISSETDTDDAAGDDAQPTDTQRDTNDTAEAIDTGPFCLPIDNTCIDEHSVRVCAEDGTTFIEETCNDDEECVDAECVPRQICTPGEKKCYDGASLMTCRPAGTGWRTETCGADTSCVDGACLSGSPNGAECTANADCANGLCHCGAEESCDPIGGVAVAPYCTAACTPGSCASGEVCLSSQDFAAAGQDHCVQVCNQTCALDGMTCASIPTRDSGSLTFEQACVPEGVVDIGLECDPSSADACAGGTCLQDYFGVGLCTSTCTGDCPDGTACVELEAGSGEHYCSPLCGDGSPGSGACPLGAGDIWVASCRLKPVFNSNPLQNLNVCFKGS